MFFCFGHVGAKTTARDQGVFWFGPVGSEFVLCSLLLMTVYLLL